MADTPNRPLDRQKFLSLALAMHGSACVVTSGAAQPEYVQPTQGTVVQQQPAQTVVVSQPAPTQEALVQPAPTQECTGWTAGGQCNQWRPQVEASAYAPAQECVGWTPAGECHQWAPRGGSVRVSPSGE